MLYLGRVQPVLSSTLIITTVIIILLFIYQKRKLAQYSQKQQDAFWRATYSAILPLLSVIISIFIFTIQGGHPTAQYGSPSTLWFIFFLLFIFTLPFTILNSLISLVTGFSPLKNPTNFIYCLLILFFSTLSLICVLNNFPTA